MEKITSRSILVITERFSPENFLINDLVAAWQLAGYSVRVVTQVPSYPKDTLFPGYPNKNSARVENGIFVQRFTTVLGYTKSRARKILNYFLFMIRACKYAFRESHGVDSVFVYHTGPLTQALPLVLIKKFRRIRTIIWTQDVWPDAVFAYGFPDKGIFAVLLKSFVRLIYRHTDEIIVSSPGFVARLNPYIPQNSTASFIPQWVPDEFMREEPHGLNLQCQGLKFIFTGSIGTMQNLENLIKAFAAIKPELATLFLLGDGSKRQDLEEMVAEKKLKNIIFLGSVPQARVKNCITACDFSILSLKGDPLISLTIPAKFQTYLAAGKPMLAIAHGEVRSIVDQAHIGLCADPDSIESIVATLHEAIHSSANMREQWSRNMAVLLEEQYSKKKTIRAITTTIFPQPLRLSACAAGRGQDTIMS